jgi:hypothetical protein
MLDSYVVRRLAAVSMLSRRHAEAGTQSGTWTAASITEPGAVPSPGNPDSLTKC